MTDPEPATSFGDADIAELRKCLEPTRERFNFSATMNRWLRFCAQPPLLVTVEMSNDAEAAVTALLAADQDKLSAWFAEAEELAETLLVYQHEAFPRVLVTVREARAAQERMLDAMKDARAAWDEILKINRSRGEESRRPRSSYRDRVPAYLLALIFQEFTDKLPGRKYDSYAADARHRNSNSPFYRFAAMAYDKAGFPRSDPTFRDAVTWLKAGLEPSEYDGWRSMLWGGLVPKDGR